MHNNKDDIIHHLKTEFNDLITQYGTNSSVSDWADALIQAYSEPQRHYHTTRHIYSMLQCFEQNKSRISEPMVIELAIYFHDWIYDPLAKDNEIQSLGVFESFASEMKLSDDLRDKVCIFIKATIKHAIPEGNEHDEDLKLFLDFDLEVLSRNEAEYQEYSREIRQEYIHFSDIDYTNGRIKVLETFIERPNLYFSTFFREQKEDIARRNIKAEIDALRVSI